MLDKKHINADHIGFDGLLWALFNDGFHIVGDDDGDSVVLECHGPQMLVEIWYRGDMVTKITCNSASKENFIPLSVSGLNLFIIGMRTKRPELIIVN